MGELFWNVVVVWVLVSVLGWWSLTFDGNWVSQNARGFEILSYINLHTLSYIKYD